MNGNNGLWFSFPQLKTEEGGETKYYDQMFLTAPEREHVRTFIVTQLSSEGYIDEPQQGPGQQQKQNFKARKGGPQTFKNQDLSEHYTPQQDDGIPF